MSTSSPYEPLFNAAPHGALLVRVSAQAHAAVLGADAEQLKDEWQRDGGELDAFAAALRSAIEHEHLAVETRGPAPRLRLTPSAIALLSTTDWAAAADQAVEPAGDPLDDGLGDDSDASRAGHATAAVPVQSSPADAPHQPAAGPAPAPATRQSPKVVADSQSDADPKPDSRLDSRLDSRPARQPDSGDASGDDGEHDAEDGTGQFDVRPPESADDDILTESEHALRTRLITLHDQQSVSRTDSLTRNALLQFWTAMGGTATTLDAALRIACRDGELKPLRRGFETHFELTEDGWAYLQGQTPPELFTQRLPAARPADARFTTLPDGPLMRVLVTQWTGEGSTHTLAALREHWRSERLPACSLWHGLDLLLRDGFLTIEAGEEATPTLRLTHDGDILRQRALSISKRIDTWRALRRVDRI